MTLRVEAGIEPYLYKWIAQDAAKYQKGELIRVSGNDTRAWGHGLCVNCGIEVKEYDGIRVDGGERHFKGKCPVQQTLSFTGAQETQQ